jgi:myo-inositol-1(or 4)-monophosphatase
VRPANEAIWIVDPLDGTSNFAHGYPIFAISIACVDRDGPLVGVVLDPLRQELFTAIRGGGARLNGRPVQVSRTEALEEALFSTGYPYFPPEQRRLAGEVFVEVMVTAAANRRGGSAALDLAYVAAGRSEAHYEMNLAAHDVAAGVLLVDEGGGRVDALAPVGHAGWPPGFLATNGRALHAVLAEMVAPRFGLAPCPLSFASLFADSAGRSPA